MVVVENFIDGKYTGSVSGEFIDIYAPALGEIYGKLPRSGKEDVDNAVRAALKSKYKWGLLSITERSKILYRIADLIEENLDMLAISESRDTGKPISVAKSVDIPRAAANFRFFASAIVNYSSSAHVMEGLAVNYTRRAPLGVVGCISPWNLPLYLFTWKIAPALAMGNCVVAKPSELTPVTAFLLGEITRKAGLPDGVLNIVQGYGNEVGQAIVDHPEIKAISFTGGTETGKTIGQAAAKQFKKVSLELGGKNPTIVFDDCDFDTTVSEVVRSAFANQGEICLCGSRILIQKNLYGRFKDAFIEKVNRLKKGDPGHEKTEFGSLISQQHQEKVLGFIEQAIKEGGKILTGGKSFQPEGLPGYFVQPTVMEGLGPTCSINQEEVFGPVVTLLPFDDEKEALEIANGTTYGLAASLWTQDIKKAHRMAHKLESGIVWVNCWMLRDLRTPFGGMKNSGVGREGGEDALRFFSEAQNICIKI